MVGVGDRQAENRLNRLASQEMVYEAVSQHWA
jgi:hypothetical protein